MPLLAALLLAQDLSTPEKAAGAYIEAFDRHAEEHDRIVVETHGALCTDDFNKRRPAGSSFSRLISWRVTERSESGGAVTLTTELKRTLTRRNFRTGKDEEVEHAYPRRFVLALQRDSRWLVEKDLVSCFACREAAGKDCSVCQGQRWSPATVVPGVSPFAPAAPGPRTDTSSARATADAFADAVVHQHALAAQADRRRTESCLKLLKTHAVESLWKPVEAALEKVRASDGKGEKRGVTVDSVAEEKEAATAVLTEAGLEPMRLTIRKTGDRWLVDDITRPCGTCSRSGRCKACPAAGDCAACRGSRQCPRCKGVGWR